MTTRNTTCVTVEMLRALSQVDVQFSVPYVARRLKLVLVPLQCVKVSSFLQRSDWKLNLNVAGFGFSSMFTYGNV